MNTDPKNPIELKEQVLESAGNLAAGAKECASDLKRKASDALGQAMDHARSSGCELSGRAKDLIRRKPLPSIVGFAALGFALGYMLRNRREDSWLDVVDFSPLRRKLGRSLAGLKDQGHDLLEEVQNRLPVDRVLEQARSLGKTLKFR